MDAIWNGILYYLLEWSVILTDAILEPGKLNKIVDGLAAVGEGNRNNSIFVIILWWVGPEKVGKFLDKG